MSEKLLEIHGFLSQQGGILGATEDFKYFEIDIPELHFPSVDVAGVSLDILVTVLIAKSSVPANIGKQATRRIKAVAIRAASRVITVNKTVEGIIVDTEMELAQTNLVIYKNRLFLAVTGTSSGDLFSCSASVRYLATGEHEVQKHRKPVEQVGSGTIIDYPNSPLDVDHNDLDGRSADSCHPATAIDYDNINSGLVAVDATSQYVILAYSDLRSVNEGLLRGATANTVTLNTNASPIDNTYRGQLIFLVSGTGQDQTGMVIAYDGATKIATVEADWDTLPDDTTGYVMIPSSPVLLAATKHSGAVIPTVEISLVNL
jgi:hypothetical protein